MHIIVRFGLCLNLPGIVRQSSAFRAESSDERPALRSGRLRWSPTSSRRRDQIRHKPAKCAIQLPTSTVGKQDIAIEVWKGDTKGTNETLEKADVNPTLSLPQTGHTCCCRRKVERPSVVSNRSSRPKGIVAAVWDCPWCMALCKATKAQWISKPKSARARLLSFVCRCRPPSRRPAQRAISRHRLGSAHTCS